MTPDGAANVQLRFSGPGVPLGAAATFGVLTAFAEFTPLEAAAEIHGAFSASILNVMSFSVALESTYIKYGPDDSGPSAEFVSQLGGGVADQSGSPAVAMLATKRTNLGGRRFRGRFYVPGIGEDSVDPGGNIVGDLVTDWPEACENFRLGLEAAGLPMLLLHSDETDPTLVVSLEGQLKVATQRRRLRR